MRKLWLTIAMMTPLVTQAQNQCTAPPADYVLRANTGSPVPQPSTKNFNYTLKNDTNITIRLENINPFAFKCTASTSVTDNKETAIGSFLGLIGGVANLQPAAAPALTRSLTDTAHSIANFKLSTEPANGCAARYSTSSVHREVLDLELFRQRINEALRVTKNNQDTVIANFNDLMHGLVELSASTSCSDTVARAQELLTRPLFTIETVNSARPSPEPIPIPIPLPLDQMIDEVTAQAQALLGHLNDGLDESCKREQARPYIDEDSAFLSAFVVGTTAAPSAVEKWRTDLKNLNAVRMNILNAQHSIEAVLANPQNFITDTSIHGNQQTVTYTATCIGNTLQTIPPPDSASVSSATRSSTVGGNTTPITNVWKHDFRFGLGPRFVYAGGIVISPLPQNTFSTTATPGGSANTANTIVLQQNSGTRILPIAMLHARYWDQLPTNKVFAWIPNYLSVGVTAKPSDTKGTNIEYLFGPSWSFADRQIFVTAGAYSGQQQRLANSLSVGSTTSLSSSNLPITQNTIWKVGFAITWAPGGK